MMPKRRKMATPKKQRQETPRRKIPPPRAGINRTTALDEAAMNYMDPESSEAKRVGRRARHQRHGLRYSSNRRTLSIVPF
mmetsp:Transcript_71261/g.137609  ORF Transcript_71261/g.137609 Transcript_71261/m.137609 type:complete len:80 (-) Transcript_71261:170-409(-)